MTTIFELVKDPYERKARVVPGLLVALPLLVPLLCVYGAKHPVLTGVIGLLGGCGAIYALASVARGRGKKLEELLVKKWGGMPTTIALRHRDNFLDSVSNRGTTLRSQLNWVLTYQRQKKNQRTLTKRTTSTSEQPSDFANSRVPISNSY